MGIFSGKKPDCDLDFKSRMLRTIQDLADDMVNELNQDQIDKSHLKDTRDKAKAAIDLYIKKCGKIEDKGITYTHADKALQSLFEDRYAKYIEDEDLKRHLQD